MRPLALALAILAGPVPAQALEFKVCSLVEAKAVRWNDVPAEAVIDPGRLSFKRKVFLESCKTIPVRSPAVKNALADALKDAGSGDRKRTRKVLDAIGNWAGEHLRESPDPPACYANWLTAPQVIEAGEGNGFELARAVVAMLRAAGIPARPTYNGVPVFHIYVTPPGKSGFWTLWDPVHPSGSLRRLPVLWIPLRAGEVSVIQTRPENLACGLTIEGRRFGGRDAAARAFEEVEKEGRFPSDPPDPLSAEARDWWEVWAVGAKVEAGAEGAFSATVVLPYVKELSYGAREHAVWTSVPSRLRKVSPPHAQTDQLLGGLVLTVEVLFGPDG